MNILLQGREFGVGVILASQFLNHFKPSKTDWAEPLLTWFVHKVPSVSQKDLERVGIKVDGFLAENEEGSKVSAGEKQLITIARAFLADPALLILAEATSSVDTRTELLLQHAMAALRTGRKSFVIAAEGAYFDLYQSPFAAAIED